MNMRLYIQYSIHDEHAIVYIQVFPVLWKFVCLDVISTWKIAPLFQKHSEPHILIAEPLEVHVQCIYVLYYSASSVMDLDYPDPEVTEILGGLAILCT